MIKNSNEKRFKKDIYILKIQGNSKYCKQHGVSNCEDCYILAQYAQVRNFTKHIFKKHTISCHNLFLLGKRGSTRYLTLQENHNVSICGVLLFWVIGPKYGNHLQGATKR